MERERKNNQEGFTILELVIAFALVAILSAAAISNLKEVSDPLTNATFAIEHYIRLARSKAISRTEAVTIEASGNNKIVAKSADTCSDTPVLISGFFLDLPNGSSLRSTSWSVCFNSRGFTQSHTAFDVADAGGGYRTINVALGGAVKVD